MKAPLSSLHLSTLGIGVFLLFSAPGASAQTLLLQDDFNDEVIDPSLWTTDALPVAPFYLPRSVTESSGVMEFLNRGYLISANDYEPISLGGIRIRGSWQAVKSGDKLTVATRSDGIRSTNQLNLDTGLAFHVTVSPFGSLSIEHLEGGLPVTLASVPVSVMPGEVFAFEVIDDGLNVSLSIFRNGSEVPNATVTAALSADGTSNRVVFHNNASSFFSFFLSSLDEVTIESLAVEEDPTPEEVVVEAVETVQSLELPKGTSTALVSKLDHALLDLAFGNLESALGKLRAFIHHVEAQAGKKISQEDAEELIASVAMAIDGAMVAKDTE